VEYPKPREECAERSAECTAAVIDRPDQLTHNDPFSRTPEEGSNSSFFYLFDFFFLIDRIGGLPLWIFFAVIEGRA
jgi:hypothetical protein